MRRAHRRLPWIGLLAGLTLTGGAAPAGANEEGAGRAAAPLDPVYVEECGACHVPYPAWALPARSWERMMGGLADHFGDNAELAPDTAAAIARYLKENAADVVRHGMARELTKGVGRDDAPLRITELRGFVKEHRKAADKAMKAKPDLKLGQCGACHTKAAQGSYREREIDVPGVGRWKD